jgi:tRNA threonylcarbamoyladenosine biosynthesis protein TsaE
MENTFFIPTESAMLALGQTLAKTCGSQGAWIYLCGELGAGKTTLVRGFLQGLGYQGRVKSPTYTLVEPYELNNISLYHFDFYRISQPAELTYLGLEEYFTCSAICLVEWPDHFMDLLPVPDILAFFNTAAEGRQLRLASKTPRGVALLSQLVAQQAEFSE